MNLAALRLDEHGSCEALEAALLALPGEQRGERRIRFAPGRFLWLPEQLPTRVFLLTEGRVEIATTSADGRETILQTVEPSQMFGYLCFCSHRTEPLCTSARALIASTVLRTSKEALRRALIEGTMVATHLLKAICSRASAAEARVSVLAIHDAPRRLATLLQHLAWLKIQKESLGAEAVPLYVSHAELAGMACLTRTHITTIMSRFNRSGVVSYRRGQAIQVNLAALEAFLQAK